MDTSDITDADLQDDPIRPAIFEEYKKQKAKRMKGDKFLYFCQVILVLYFKILKVFSERKLIWLKILLNWC